MKKNLLWHLCSFLLIPIINNCSIVNNHHKLELYNQSNEITWSFSEEDQAEIVQTTYFHKTVYKRILFTTIPVDSYPWKLNEMKFIGCNNCQSKVSWGTWAYFGTKINDFLEGKNFGDMAENVIITDSNIGDVAHYEMLNIKDNDGSAVLIAKEFIGLAWHYNNDLNAYILGMGFYFYAETWGSGVGGGMWMNIGEGMKITLEK